MRCPHNVPLTDQVLSLFDEPDAITTDNPQENASKLCFDLLARHGFFMGVVCGGWGACAAQMAA